jgi:hypothetical protein
MGEKNSHNATCVPLLSAILTAPNVMTVAERLSSGYPLALATKQVSGEVRTYFRCTSPSSIFARQRCGCLPPG